MNRFSPGNYYHIYNRGAGRARIFFNDGNYEYCLRLLKKYTQEYQIAVIAYCLMTNHYHFLLRQVGDIPISTLIQMVFNTYVQAVNRQQGRTGTLFEGRYKHVNVDREEYLIHVCRYIHGNPVKAGLVSRPQDWPFSNYLEWINKRAGTLVDRSFVETFFPQAERYAAFVDDYLCEADKLPKGIERYLLT